MRCDICNTSYSQGHKVDLGFGMMTFGEHEPQCDCYEMAQCYTCGEEMLQHELEEHMCNTDYCLRCNSEYAVNKGCEVCEE